MSKDYKDFHITSEPLPDSESQSIKRFTEAWLANIADTPIRKYAEELEARQKLASEDPEHDAKLLLGCRIAVAELLTTLKAGCPKLDLATLLPNGAELEPGVVETGEEIVAKYRASMWPDDQYFNMVCYPTPPQFKSIDPEETEVVTVAFQYQP